MSEQVYKANRQIIKTPLENRPEKERHLGLKGSGFKFFLEKLNLWKSFLDFFTNNSFFSNFLLYKKSSKILIRL